MSSKAARLVRAKAKAKRNRIMRNPLGAAPGAVSGVLREMNQARRIQLMQKELKMKGMQAMPQLVKKYGFE